jgi:hypothetical protein
MCKGGGHEGFVFEKLANAVEAEVEANGRKLDFLSGGIAYDRANFWTGDFSVRHNGGYYGGTPAFGPSWNRKCHPRPAVRRHYHPRREGPDRARSTVAADRAGRSRFGDPLLSGARRLLSFIIRVGEGG